jgi:hypothetical protein
MIEEITEHVNLKHVRKKHHHRHSGDEMRQVPDSGDKDGSDKNN